MIQRENIAYNTFTKFKNMLKMNDSVTLNSYKKKIIDVLQMFISFKLSIIGYSP